MAGVFRKGDDLRRAYRACIDTARTRPEVFWPDFAKAGARFQAVIAPAKQVGKMSATRASESLPKLGALLTSAHLSRADAEAAIVEWQQKQRRR